MPERKSYLFTYRVVHEAVSFGRIRSAKSIPAVTRTDGLLNEVASAGSVAWRLIESSEIRLVLADIEIRSVRMNFTPASIPRIQARPTLKYVSAIWSPPVSDVMRSPVLALKAYVAVA